MSKILTDDNVLTFDVCSKQCKEVSVDDVHFIAAAFKTFLVDRLRAPLHQVVVTVEIKRNPGEQE